MCSVTKNRFQSTCPARGTTPRRRCTLFWRAIFQSTCPARGTTRCPGTAARPACDFNPRAPRGARHLTTKRCWRLTLFQSTCPARGTTTTPKFNIADIKPFQSTCPARGTTAAICKISFFDGISIHVPREGHDQYAGLGQRHGEISIHVPREGHDTEDDVWAYLGEQFQSTCPARGTTELTEPPEFMLTFQSTCPARGTTNKF